MYNDEILKLISGNAYLKKTGKILVQVYPVFVEKKENIAGLFYNWSYFVSIKNCDDYAIKLLSKCWYVIDGFGNTIEDHEIDESLFQKLIFPNEKIEFYGNYSLTSSSGMMFGCYDALSCEDNSLIKIDIPLFSLDSPDAKRKIN